MFFLRSMVSKFMFWSIVLLLLVGVTGAMSLWNNQNAKDIHGNFQRDFVSWQNQYKDIAYQLSNDPTVKQAIQDTGVEVKQVTVVQFPQLQQDGTQQQRVDRCESCHVGLTNPAMTAENIISVVDKKTVTAAQVGGYLEAHPDTRAVVETLGAHPGILTSDQTDLGVAHSPHLRYGVTTATSPTPDDLADYATQKENLKQHPFPTFGCTTCHYGSGRDLVQYKAHQMVDDDPSLNPDLLESANIIPIPGTQLLPARYMEAACAQCHASYDPKTFKISYLPQMQSIARGEQLFKSQACYGCHKIEGFSKGNIGPELTYESRSKPIESIQHQLWDPRYLVSSCVMPYFFATRKTNTDDPDLQRQAADIVDPRSQTTQMADIQKEGAPDYDEAIAETLRQHGYIADASRQADVDALVTFIASQTGQNYAASQASRYTTVAAYNLSTPPDVPVTAAEGKTLFETSGCYACHYIGNPNVKHVTGDPQFGKGGVAGPELSWEGSRHSQQWLVAHYENPQAFVPGSIMPIFPFSNSERAALSLYDSSQRPANPGARPVSPDQDMPTPQQTTAGVQTNAIRYMTR